MATDPTKHTPTFNVRLPSSVQDRLAEEAAANGRTRAAELRSRLERSFDIWSIRREQANAGGDIGVRIIPEPVDRVELTAA